MDANRAEPRWGVDDAGSTIGIDRHPKGAELIGGLGFDLIVHRYQPAGGDPNRLSVTEAPVEQR